MFRTTTKDQLICPYCREPDTGPDPTGLTWDNGDVRFGEATGLYAYLWEFVTRAVRDFTPQGPTLDLGASSAYVALCPQPHFPAAHVTDGVMEEDDESVGCILCTETLEHIDDPIRTIASCARVLAPGGVLILTTPSAWGVHPCADDCWRMQPDGARYAFQKAGLTLARAEWTILGENATCGCYVGIK